MVVVAVLTRTIAVRTASDGHTRAVAVVEVTNLGTQADFIRALVTVNGERGREFSWVTFSGPDTYGEVVLAARHGATPC